MIKKIFLTALLMSAFTTMKAEQKIAVIDMDKVFSGYYKTKITEGNLKKQAEIYRVYAEKLKESLIKLQEEYKAVRDDALSVALSDSERENKRIEAQDKYRQLKAKEAEMKQYEREKRVHLKEEFEKMRITLIGEIKKEIKKKCALEGYSLALDRSGKSLNNIPIVIEFNSSIDISEDIIKELNRGHKTKKETKKDKK